MAHITCLICRKCKSFDFVWFIWFLVNVSKHLERPKLSEPFAHFSPWCKPCHCARRNSRVVARRASLAPLRRTSLAPSRWTRFAAHSTSSPNLMSCSARRWLVRTKIFVAPHQCPQKGFPQKCPKTVNKWVMEYNHRKCTFPSKMICFLKMFGKHMLP